MKKTLLLAAVAALFSFNAFAQETSVTTPTADTWVGINGEGTIGNMASNKQLEMRTSSSTTKNFYALISFNFTTPSEGHRVKSATLRLTTRYKKGDSQVNIYDYPNTFEETNTWNDVSSNIESALKADSVATFKLNGCGGWAPTDGEHITDNYLTVDKWQNTVDITSLVKKYAADGKISILLAKPYDQDNSSQIYSKEATDETNSAKNYTFAAADLVPQLTVEYEEGNASDQSNSVTQPSADTWTGEGVKNMATNNTLEIRSYAEKPTNYYALMAFHFAVPEEGNEVSKATLRLTARYKKGDSGVQLYDLNSAFEETATYDDVKSAIETALAGEPATTFKLNSYAQWAPTDNAVTEEFSTVDKWQTNVDVTNLIKSHASEGTVYMLLKKTMDQDNSSQIYSREATDVTNTNLNFTFKAEDLVPQLTVAYVTTGTTAISSVETQKPAVNSDAIYNLAGQRVGKDYKGIVIKNGKKILVR